MSTMTAFANNNHNAHSDALADPRSRKSCFGDRTVAPQVADFPRSASYTFLGHAATKNPAYNSPRPQPITIKGSFSEDDLVEPIDESSTDASPSGSSGFTTPCDEHRSTTDLSSDLVAELGKRPDITVTENEDQDALSLKDGTSSLDSAKMMPAAPTARSRPQSTSFAKRLSWRMSYTPSTPSRSPSPGDKKSKIRIDNDAQQPEPVPTTSTPGPATATRRKSIFRKRDAEKEREKGKETEKEKEKEKEKNSEDGSSGGFLARRGTVLRRKKSVRNVAPTVRASMEVPSKPEPLMPSLPKSFSTDKLHTTSPLSHDLPSPMPPLVSGEKYQTVHSLSLPRKKDELWSVFRSLDGDFTKFQSKSSALKANVVRSSLLPFLRNYADHSSNTTLRPEDLDRRANILNKWWTALLDMLHGRNNQSISGTDRPAILDGISGIMDRSEWRLSPSPFCPLDRRNVGVATSRNKSSSSLTSTGGDFLLESVHHNVRNMFVQNLSSQMAFVVDRMSLRNASASLVTFCGKATAYAFFFCPGIAEVLVRLWDAPTETMRRVVKAGGIGKFEDLVETSARITSAFPPSIQPLGFISLAKMLRHLKTQTPLPLGTANIQWYGYWLERWSGRESDLFYAFVKNYHILVADYLPTDANEKEKMCVPGLLFVHSQILANLDSTIHRDAGPSLGDPSNTTSPTFGDVLADTDAVASTLPLPPTNSIRIMAENRIIMLIRDFLSERASEHPFARQLFADSFARLLEACAGGISVYSHLACYTLCDFLEEAFPIILRYEQIHPSYVPLIDTHFWTEVCKRMIFSQNTMTEIRLFAFLFTVWNTINSNTDRKAEICLGLLLDPEVFEKTFNHWCPMVRAHYMRLLCWRLGRYDGEATSGDLLIFETLLRRLRGVWSHYLWQRERAALIPSTTPCNPAPGRRLLIIRTDTQLAPGGSFLAFDGLGPPNPSAPMRAPSQAWKRNSTILQATSLDIHTISSASSDISELERSEGRFRGFLRSMIGGSKSRPKVNSAPATSKSLTGTELSRSATDDSRISRAHASASKSTPQDTPVASRAPSPIRHRNFCFKFSLELHPKAHHHTAMRLAAPRLPMAAHVYVQAESEAEKGASRAVEPVGDAKARSTYSGRALAEWMCVVMECQSFFERRKGEGVPSNKYVETPTLGVEVFSKRA